MQGVNYPITLNFNNPRANYTITDPITGAILGTVKAGTTANIIINYSKSNSFKLSAEPSNETFFLNVNNNPVNTNTAEINLGIDNNAEVNISLFNSLGSEVIKLNTMHLNKGIHNTTIDVTNLPTGSYTLKMTANGEAKIFMINIIK